MRSLEVVTQKVTDGVSRIRLGCECRLGTIEAQRDWGHTAGHVPAMRMMLQQDVASDYVVTTVATTSVRDMCRNAFRHVGIDMGSHRVIDPALHRPAEVDVLLGNPAKAKAALVWAPEIALETMIVEMVEADLARLRHALPQGKPA